MSKATDAIAKADRALRKLRQALAAAEVEHDHSSYEVRQRQHVVLALRAERLLNEALREVKKE